MWRTAVSSSAGRLCTTTVTETRVEQTRVVAWHQGAGRPQRTQDPRTVTSWFQLRLARRSADASWRTRRVAARCTWWSVRDVVRPAPVLKKLADGDPPPVVAVAPDHARQPPLHWVLQGQPPLADELEDDGREYVFVVLSMWMSRQGVRARRWRYLHPAAVGPTAVRRVQPHGHPGHSAVAYDVGVTSQGPDRPLGHGSARAPRGV